MYLTSHELLLSILVLFIITCYLYLSNFFYISFEITVFYISFKSLMIFRFLEWFFFLFLSFFFFVFSILASNKYLISFSRITMQITINRLWDMYVPMYHMLEYEKNLRRISYSYSVIRLTSGLIPRWLPPKFKNKK